MSGLRVREATELLATARTLTPTRRAALANIYRAIPVELIEPVMNALDALNEKSSDLSYIETQSEFLRDWDTHEGEAMGVLVMVTCATDLISAADRSALWLWLVRYLLAPWETVMGQ